MSNKLNTVIISFFALLATWVIFAAMPYFRLEGHFRQVDTQIIFLHGLCALLYFFQALKFIFNKNEINYLSHPLIIIPFLLAILGIISGLFESNTNLSFSGSPQIGQGVFWYFDLAVMTLLFSQVLFLRKVRLILFINLVIITTIVSIFTFFPYWKGLPIGFYYFTDYLCFYGILNFIMLTTITKNYYINFLGFIALGGYLSLLDNRSAILIWFTTLLVGITFYLLKLFNRHYEVKKIISFLFSNSMFVFIIIFFSALTVFSSIYFWPGEYGLPFQIKDSHLDSLVVRGKIIENSVASLDNLKHLFLGAGWGRIPDLLLENMTSWQYDQLRLGHNLHFHTHNELAEHFVSIGLIGGTIYLIYMYFIFEEADKSGFIPKLGWLLFFKVTCFWFLWTGTLTLFALVLSCFIKVRPLISTRNKFIAFFNPGRKKNIFFSCSFLIIGCFLIYGSFITYSSTKVQPRLTYAQILDFTKNSEKLSHQCLQYYDDFNRGGYMLERFLDPYSSYVLLLDEEELKSNSLRVLQELQCKANSIIKSGKASFMLLSTAMKVDAKYYFRFEDSEQGNKYFKNYYKGWYMKALLMTEKLPKRGDLLLPFLSYALNNNKIEDAVNICKKKVKGIEAFCDLIFAYELLESKEINNVILNESIRLATQAVDKGIFNELLFGFWYKGNKNYHEGKDFQHYGVKGIPLAPDILFLVSEEEKVKLENIIGLKNN